MKISNFQPENLHGLKNLLTRMGLPTNDLPDDFSNFVVAIEDDKVVGSAGVQLLDSVGLLRSVAVAPSHQKRGLGGQLQQAAIELASGRGIGEIYLITETADGFFERMGFHRIGRNEAPAEVRGTWQFMSGCPSSAVVMRLIINNLSSKISTKKMSNSKEIKDSVREKYAEIASQDRETNATSCCGATSSGTYTIMSENYAHLEGYNPDADLGLGCGLPTEFAKINEGDTVLDLGSGAGNDCFVARAETGPAGKVIGVDFTPEMIARARANAEKRGFNNVEFRQGDIEDLPVSDGTVDVVVSNCVLNLVPDKRRVFSEISRVLKPGGHFSISDVVLSGHLPEKLQNAAEMYAGCISGASQLADYLELIREAGFENLTVQKQKPILIPDDVLLDYLSPEEIRAFAASKTGIFSITVYAEKPGGDPGEKTRVFEKRKVQMRELAASAGKACCGAGSGCC